MAIKKGTIKSKDKDTGVVSDLYPRTSTDQIEGTWETLQAVNLTDGSLTKTMTEVLQGTGHEPELYLKDASVAGNVLTLTKKNLTTVEFEAQRTVLVGSNELIFEQQHSPAGLMFLRNPAYPTKADLPYGDKTIVFQFKGANVWGCGYSGVFQVFFRYTASYKFNFKHSGSQIMLGRAAGDFMIYGSSDSGASWTLIKSGTGYNYSATIEAETCEAISTNPAQVSTDITTIYTRDWENAYIYKGYVDKARFNEDLYKFKDLDAHEAIATKQDKAPVVTLTYEQVESLEPLVVVPTATQQAILENLDNTIIKVDLTAVYLVIGLDSPYAWIRRNSVKNIGSSVSDYAETYEFDSDANGLNSSIEMHKFGKIMMLYVNSVTGSTYASYSKKLIITQNNVWPADLQRQITNNKNDITDHASQISQLWTGLDIKVDGANSSTTNAIARFDNDSGKAIKNSRVTIDDNGNLTISAPAQTDVSLNTTGEGCFSLAYNGSNKFSVSSEGVFTNTGKLFGNPGGYNNIDLATSLADPIKFTTFAEGYYGYAKMPVNDGSTSSNFYTIATREWCNTKPAVTPTIKVLPEELVVTATDVYLDLNAEHTALCRDESISMIKLDISDISATIGFPIDIAWMTRLYKDTYFNNNCYVFNIQMISVSSSDKKVTDTGKIVGIFYLDGTGYQDNLYIYFNNNLPTLNLQSGAGLRSIKQILATSASGNDSAAFGLETTASNQSAFAIGSNTTASGMYSLAEGYGTQATAEGAHAEGGNTIADGNYAHAEGGGTVAHYLYSHAEGFNTVTGANYQHVSGMYNDPKWNTLFEVGNGSESVRSNAFEVYQDGTIKANYLTDGITTKTITQVLAGGGSGPTNLENGSGSESLQQKSKIDTTITGEGDTYNIIVGTSATAEQKAATRVNCKAEGTGSFAEGASTIADEAHAHSEGIGTWANHVGSHAEGERTKTQGNFSHSEGQTTTAYADISHAEGVGTSTGSSSDASHDTAKGSHAEGTGTVTHAKYSHAEGEQTYTNGRASHSEGYKTNAEGNYSHASGKGDHNHVVTVTGDTYVLASNTYGIQVQSTMAYRSSDDTTYIAISSYYTHGNETAATFLSNVSAGNTVCIKYTGGSYTAYEVPTIVSKDGSSIRVTGNMTTAITSSSATTVEIYRQVSQTTAGCAKGIASSTNGLENTAVADNQFIVGKYNKNSFNTLFEVGNGTDNSSRSNAFEVYNDGSATVGAMGTDDLSIATKGYVDSKPKLYVHTLTIKNTSVEREQFIIISSRSSAYTTGKTLYNDYVAKQIVSCSYYQLLRSLPNSEIMQTCSIYTQWVDGSIDYKVELYAISNTIALKHTFAATDSLSDSVSALTADYTEL